MTACMPVIMCRLLDPMHSCDDLGIRAMSTQIPPGKRRQSLPFDRPDERDIVQPRRSRLSRAPTISYIIYEPGRKMRPEPSLTLTKRIVAALTERIVNGSLPPGAPVRQDQVAEEFGSSHV